jgi:hypothetical protein
MAREARPSATTLNLRLDAGLKKDFTAAAEAESRPGAAVLRGLMRRYVAEARRRRIAIEARRQSRLLAGSEDEAEVMRWIQDVSAPEGDK